MEKCKPFGTPLGLLTMYRIEEKKELFVGVKNSLSQINNLRKKNIQ
jgi:hypothetical protein